MKLSNQDLKELVEFAAGRETLPFVIRVARTDEQLSRVCKLRGVAYGTLNPELGEKFSRPDQTDFEEGTVILYAQDKVSGDYISTARMRTNANKPLDLQLAVPLPRQYECQHLAEITRLATLPNYSMRTNVAMFKSIWMLCWAKQVHTLFGAARDHVKDAYARLGFEYLFDGNEFPLHYGGGFPHRVLAIDIVGAERKWSSMSHALYDFFVKTFHPDIEVFSSVNTMWSNPREGSGLTAREKILPNYQQSIGNAPIKPSGPEVEFFPMERVLHEEVEVHGQPDHRGDQAS